MNVYEKTKKDYDTYFKPLKRVSSIDNFKSTISDLKFEFKNRKLYIFCRVSYGVKPVDSYYMPPAEVKRNMVMVDRISQYRQGNGPWIKMLDKVIEEYRPVCVDIFENTFDFDKNIIYNLYLLIHFLKKNESWVTNRNISEIKKNALYILKKFDKEKYKKIDKNQIETEIKTYLIKDLNTNFYKIGKSKDPLKREKTLQCEKPTYKLIKIFSKNIEKDLHEIYHRQRLRGEWFSLTPIQVRYICTHY